MTGAQALPPHGRLLAVDVGAKRIGLALSDPDQMVAHPLATVTRRAGKRFPMRALRTHLERQRPVGVVVGLPLTPEGAEDARAAEAREVGSLIQARSGLPVAFQDERMTTARALSAVRDLGGGMRGKKDRVDQLAATTLLQSFLDGRR
ncbi:MAG: Holliday junction resolvase RuvX [Gemmatimonadales bacterium]|jgi:putative Holliday junction resolvase